MKNEERKTKKEKGKCRIPHCSFLIVRSSFFILRHMTQAPGEVDQQAIALADVEHELMRRVHALQAPGEAPMQRACMSNLVIYCDRLELAQAVEQSVPSIVAEHPARVLLLVGEAEGEGNELTAQVNVRARPGGAGRRLFSEQVTLHAGGTAVSRLPFAVRELLIGDLPYNLWWAVPQPPSLAGVLFHDLTEEVEQVVYDSIGWPEPARGVLATAAWLGQFERRHQVGIWRVASDLNWRRLKYWRRLLAQAFDSASAPGALGSISGVFLEHGPHAVVQGWELVSWLASRLGWKVQAGRVETGVELAWDCTGPQGPVRLRIRRLEQGPPSIRQLRIACKLNGSAGTLMFTAEGDRRLAVVPEGIGAEPRTLTVPPLDLPELLGRQLSDRERDPVFRDSMAFARLLAQAI
jgi:glucose-6-phosphate dehydrogenase assembly protein OpcA